MEGIRHGAAMTQARFPWVRQFIWQTDGGEEGFPNEEMRWPVDVQDQNDRPVVGRGGSTSYGAIG